MPDFGTKDQLREDQGTANINSQWLYIRQVKIQWVSSHKCLRVFSITEWFNLPAQLPTGKTRSCNSVLRISGLDMGAGYHVLHSYYIHAVRSIIDYSSVSLMHLSPCQLTRPETIQNKSMRLILGAPRWTRLPNLHRESQLVPLTMSIQQMVAGFVSRVVSQDDNGPLAKSLRKVVLLPQDNLHQPGTEAFCTSLTH